MNKLRLVTGVMFVGATLVGGLAGMLPLLGPIFMAALCSQFSRVVLKQPRAWRFFLPLSGVVALAVAGGSFLVAGDAKMAVAQTVFFVIGLGLAWFVESYL